MNSRLHVCAVALLAVLLPAPLAAEAPDTSWFPQAPKLPSPPADAKLVSTVGELFHAAGNAEPGGTILIADGHYMLPSVLVVGADDVTLRSASGNRHKVILDGRKSRHGELVFLRGSDITLADLTVQNIKHNGIKIVESGSHRTTIYNCVVRNCWQRGVKASQVPPDKKDLFPRDCRIQFCLFSNDRPKRYEDDPTDTPETFDGNYVGGIDVKSTVGWTISDNVFIGIQGRTREGRAAIYISDDGRNCVVERNIVIDCDVGISLGNPSLVGDWLHCYDCVVRNNFIARCPETGIHACYTENCRILHNTIHDPESRLKRLIYILHSNEGLRVESNLLSGPPPRRMTESKITFQGNLIQPDLSSIFADVSAGDLHLRRAHPDAVDRGRRLPLVAHDFDNQPRLDRPDLGADEYRPSYGSGDDAATVALVDGTATDETANESTPAEKDAAEEVESLDWVEPMRKVHAGFDGKQGYVAQFGDSITHSLAFWSPLGWDEPQRYLEKDDGLPKKPKSERWRDVILGTRDKGPEHGNYSGWRVGNLLGRVDKVLETHQPEAAIIMIGTNDISGGKVPAGYRKGVETIVEKCLAAHCIPILNTIPPRRGRRQAVEEANRIIREIAKDKKVPLVDYYREILRLRPGDSWQGTIIGEDGVHPTAGKTNVYTTENMKQSGYALRNWLNFLALRQVYFRVLEAEK